MRNIYGRSSSEVSRHGSKCSRTQRAHSAAPFWMFTRISCACSSSPHRWQGLYVLLGFMNPFLEIRGLGHCMAPIGVRVVSLASEIGMGHYSDAPLCAASEAAAGPDFSFVRYNPTGFFMQEAQITACVCLDTCAISGSARRQKSHIHIA